MLKEENLKEDKIMGIGIAVPGLINKNENILEFAPNLGWNKLDIIKYFKSKLEFSETVTGNQVPIILENEANAAAAGEREFVYPESDNMVYVSINEGIGCGIFFNGELYRGASGNAGEFGHIIIDEEGKTCHCGNRGCWETMASTDYIKNRYQELTGNELNLQTIKKSLQIREQKLIQVLEETADNLGLGLANIINSLSPDLLIIGGDIVKFQDYIEPEIMNVLQEKSIDISLEQVEVKFTKLKGLAVVRGLASHVFDESVSLLKQRA